MENILLVIFGIISGVLGGMGMGGGTLLIPLLSFLDISQHTVQAINLISFLPMAVFALCVHFKNGLVKTKNTGWIILPAVIFSAVGAFVTKFVSGKILRYCFGLLLLGLGVWQLSKSIIELKKQIIVNKTLKRQKSDLLQKNLNKKQHFNNYLSGKDQ